MNEDVEYGRNAKDDDEKESIKHCQNSDYKYKILFASGQSYFFPHNDTLNIYNAVCKKPNI